MKIGECVFQIETPEAFEIAENIRHFFIQEKEDMSIVAYYKICIDNDFAIMPQKLLYRGNNRIIFENDSQEYRVHFIPGTQTAFAYYREVALNTNEIHILDKFFPHRVISIIFIELLALEKYLLLQQALVLHSSYIIFQDKALLFSAPSGTGKSTQAGLWEKYMGAQIINGDRSVIQLGNEVYIHSLPFCGSSGINLNKSAPLAGIILLEQATENSIQKCAVAMAAKKIFSECSINYWNRKDTEEALNLIGKIVENIPIYQLKCNISKEAVELVNDTLFPFAKF